MADSCISDLYTVSNQSKEGLLLGFSNSYSEGMTISAVKISFLPSGGNTPLSAVISKARLPK